MTQWHVPRDDLDRYRRGSANLALEASIDAHVLRCEQCRGRFADLVDADDEARHAARWRSIIDELDRPRPTAVERVLSRIGVNRETTRLVLATPALLLAWFGTVIVALGFALAAAHTGSGTAGVTTFLIAAPLVPVAGTALAYSPRTEPPGEVALATPGREFRLLLVRTLFVLAAALPCALAVGIAMPGPRTIAVMWLLPALALSAGTLAAAAWFDPLRCAVVTGVTWAGVVLVSLTDASHTSVDALAHQLAPAHPIVQVLCAVLLAAALGVIVTERHRYAYRRVA